MFVRKTLSVLLLLLPALPGPAPAQDEEKVPGDAAYFPLNPGMEWTYGAGGDIQKIVRYCDREDEYGGTDVVVVEEDTFSKEKGKIQTGPLIYSVDAKGVWLHKSSVNEYDEPLLFLRFPLKKGTTWKIVEKINVPKGGDIEERERPIRCEVMGAEKVKVKAGTYDCIRVVRRFKTNVHASKRKVEIEHHYWFAKGVGLVRIRTGGKNVKKVTYLELISFTDL